MLASSGRPRKACSRCKSQKVRCSGDKPTCRRCLRLRHACTYNVSTSNEPQVHKKRSPLDGTPVIDTPSALVPTISSQDISISVYRGCYSTENVSHTYRPTPPLLKSLSQDYYVGIPASLVFNLIEVFYSDVYNAPLLLHKRMFMEAVAAGTVRPQVILSVCALASNFYCDASNRNSLKEQGFSTQWAEHAGKLAFEEAESPNEENIVAFVNLGLFWYSQGLWQRSYIHTSNAIQLVHLLRCGIERPGKEGSLESEIRRRRFWACYLMNCQSSGSMLVLGAPEAILKLALPWPEIDFDAGFCMEPPISLGSRQSNNGIFCEIIKAMTYWSTVLNLIKHPESSTSARVTEIHALDTRISEWWSCLPASLDLTPSSISGTPQSVLHRVLLIHIAYHQCLSALHSSIVPLFSWGVSDDTWLSARNLSAQIAFEHACEASALLEAILKNSNEPSAVPSFIGYAAYSGCAIQIPFLWCSEPSVRKKAHSNVRTNIKMIRILAKYWKLSALLETHFKHLYKVHAKDPVLLENEPKYLAVGKLTTFTGSEPKARDSILGHNSILWRRGDDYANTREDTTDIDIEDENNFEHSSLTAQAFAGATTPQNLLSPSHELIVEEDQSFIPVDLNESAVVQQDFYPEQSQTLDLLVPYLNYEASDVFSNGESLDYLQFGTNSLSFGVFDG